MVYRASFKVEIGPGGLKTLFKLSDIERAKVNIKPLNREKGYSFVLKGKDAYNFETVIRNTDVPFIKKELEGGDRDA